jgi:hypothetical protein
MKWCVLLMMLSGCFYSDEIQICGNVCKDAGRVMKSYSRGRGCECEVGK